MSPASVLRAFWRAFFVTMSEGHVTLPEGESRAERAGRIAADAIALVGFFWLCWLTLGSLWGLS